MKELLNLTRGHRTEMDTTANITNSVVSRRYQPLFDSLRSNKNVRKGVAFVALTAGLTAIAAIPNNTTSNGSDVRRHTLYRDLKPGERTETFQATDGTLITIPVEPNNPNNPK